MANHRYARRLRSQKKTARKVRPTCERAMTPNHAPWRLRSVSRQAMGDTEPATTSSGATSMRELIVQRWTTSSCSVIGAAPVDAAAGTTQRRGALPPNSAAGTGSPTRRAGSPSTLTVKYAARYGISSSRSCPARPGSTFTVVVRRYVSARFGMSPSRRDGSSTARGAAPGTSSVHRASTCPGSRPHPSMKIEMKMRQSTSPTPPRTTPMQSKTVPRRARGGPPPARARLEGAPPFPVSAY